jgi:transposase
VIPQGLPSGVGLPANTRIWIAAGVTDMRCGFNSLAAKVQTALERDPYGGCSSPWSSRSRMSWMYVSESPTFVAIASSEYPVSLSRLTSLRSSRVVCLHRATFSTSPQTRHSCSS